MSVWCWTIFPAKTRRWPNGRLILAHRLRRWANISPTLGQHLVCAGIAGFIEAFDGDLIVLCLVEMTISTKHMTKICVGSAPWSECCVVKRQIAGTAYFTNKQLQLFALAGRYEWTTINVGSLRGLAITGIYGDQLGHLICPQRAKTGVGCQSSPGCHLTYIQYNIIVNIT